MGRARRLAGSCAELHSLRLVARRGACPSVGFGEVRRGGRRCAYPRGSLHRPRAGLGSVLLSLLLLVLGGQPLAGQWGEVSLEVGGSRVAPPSGVEGDAARFFVAGLRALRFAPGGSGLSASLLVGRSLDDLAGGDFLSGSLEGALWRPVSGGWSLGLELKGFGFGVEEPYPYRALGMEGGPAIRWSRPRVLATIRGLGGAGWSRSELRRYADGPAIVVEDDLWRYGAIGELLVGSPSLMVGGAVGIHETAGGTYRSAGLRLLAGRGAGGVELRVDGWRTPTGNEVTGGIALIIPLAEWSFRGFLGRNEPDPLTLAEPGGGTGGLLVGRRLAGSGPLPPARPPLHEVVTRGVEEAVIEIRVKAPRGAERVEVLGDFTLWEPVPMERAGGEWKVRLEAPFGTHHFGFLVDGQWYLPEDAPDAVSDEWGRKNATLVIEAGSPRPDAGTPSVSGGV